MGRRVIFWGLEEPTCRTSLRLEHPLPHFCPDLCAPFTPMLPPFLCLAISGTADMAAPRFFSRTALATRSHQSHPMGLVTMQMLIQEAGTEPTTLHSWQAPSPQATAAGPTCPALCCVAVNTWEMHNMDQEPKTVSERTQKFQAVVSCETAGLF